jgi:MFS family permease
MTTVPVTASPAARATTESLGAGFTRLWAAATISLLGDGATLVALPLLAASLTDRPLLIAGTQVALGLPWLLTGLLGGVIADRVDRRRLMVTVDVVRAGTAALLTIAALTGAVHLWMIWVTAFVLGMGETLLSPAAQAVLPNVVPVDALERANGRMLAAESASKELIGPAIGGALFAIAHAVPFALDAVSFVLSALLLRSLRLPERAAEQPADADIRADLARGWRYVRHHPMLRSLMCIGMAMNVAAAAVEATMVVFALRVLHVGGGGFGLLLAGAAIGGLVASLVAHRVVAALGQRTSIVVALATAGVAATLGAATSNALVAGIAIAMIFAPTAVAHVVTYSVRQAATPDELRGRVAAIFRTFMWSCWPFGALLGGVLAAHVSLRTPLFLYGATSIVLAAVAPRCLRAAGST